jgi:ATP-binding cassette subfamily C protein CydC
MALAGAAGVSMNYFTPAATIRACAIARTAGRYGERLVTHEATLRMLAGLRVWFYEHLEPLAPAGLQAYRGGDLLSRMRADIDALDNFYLRLLAPAVVALLAGVGFTAFLLLYDARLALILALALFAAGVALPWLMHRLGDAPGRELVDLRADLRAAAVDGVQGLAELQVYGADAAQADEIQRLSRRIGACQRRLAGYSGLSQGALGLTANLAMWLALWNAIGLVHEGRIAPPELAMLALFFLAAFEAVMPLPAAFQALGETRAAARRVLEIADAEPPVPEPSAPRPMPPGNDIRFEAVTFRYPGAEVPAVRDFSLHWRTGARIALTGDSGAGKTTLVQLLLRFRAPDAGRITFGGSDIAELPGTALRRRIGVVSQHTQLFTGTMRENLLLAAPDADESALLQACRDAGLEDFVAAQPDGLDTQVGEAGVALSGGQQRRLGIARVLLLDAPVLVLDEPTEGLDGPTAQALMATLERVVEGRSVLLISHRAERFGRMDAVCP